MASEVQHKNRNFCFKDDKDEVSVIINELLDADYGVFLWPSAVVLAQHIFMSRGKFIGQHVVEIGSGTSLPGLVAAKVCLMQNSRCVG